ncbi:hypothetical protein PIIN_00806 [Serendipita indica DSM 11827]|uniref:Uncharacterized protein n=1 Tax=Serendipita indica (strain DSM 11827) TaxID=1109443 RepID=G4T6M6_SERID|nr:hypothetical protein PIIN_00806 [Serendipita indica DSM 11827]
MYLSDHSALWRPHVGLCPVDGYFRNASQLLTRLNSIQGTFVDIPGRDSVISGSTSSDRQAWIAAPIVLGTVFLGILVYVLLSVWRKRRRDGYVGKNMEKAPVVSSFHTQSTVPDEKWRDEKRTGALNWTTFGSDSERTSRPDSAAESSSDPFSASYERGTVNLSSKVLTETNESRQGQGIALEDMQLSHEELVLIFQRVKELRNLVDIGKTPEFDEGDRADRLETLARGLAGIRVRQI